VKGLATLLLLAAVAAAQSAPTFGDPYSSPALALKIGAPREWSPVFEGGALVLSQGGIGFRVSREPFLFDPKTFAAEWEARLGEAGIGAKVQSVKAGKYEAYRVAYETGEPKRCLEIWRLRVPEVEMLYNLTFSTPAGYDAKPLVEGVLKGFQCTASPPKLEFEEEPVRLGNLAEFRLPKGLAKAEGSVPPPLEIAYAAKLAGYGEPRESFVLRIYAFDQRINPYRVPGWREFSGSDLDAVVDAVWADLAKPLKRTDKPKGGAGRTGPFKGASLSGGGTAADGTEKALHVAAAKVREKILVWAFRADAREARLCRNLFKEICDTIKEGS